jgi:carbamoyltransferase
LELAIMYLAHHLRELSDSQNLCYAGGVALNCIVNERLYLESGYENIYIPPAAEDSGPAIGAAYYGLWQLTGRIAREPLLHDSVGRRYSVREIEAAINSTPAVVIKELSGDKLLDHTVERLCVGDLVGWFQGGSELGPRALGQRSILADPRKAEAKTILNSRIKSRESFRPFAPAVLVEEAPGWLDFSGVLPESPFMLRVVEFRPEVRSLVPAVVHVDGTGRVQTVSKEFGGRFYELIRRFYYATGIPILLNTSFNGRNEPIVETPEDALWCMLQNGLDFVVLEDRIVEREPGTESILDLYPRIISNIYSIDDLTQEASSAPRKTNLLANVTTRWGSQQKRIPGYYNTLLQAIDGRKNGWMLLEQLWSENGVNLDERWLIEALGALRRDSVITFQRIR